MPKLINNPGDRIGRLTLVRHISKRGWLCKCDCGKRKMVSTGNLKKTNSCGCLRREVTGNQFRKHGKFGTPEYLSWIAMKARCDDKDRYAGKKGIKVCSRWINSFNNFLEDMKHKPVGDYVIERINPNKDYSPRNCLWVPREENKPDSRDGVETIWGKSKRSSKFTGLLEQLRDVQRLDIARTGPDKIAGLEPEERFLYWISHRHEIWLKRELGFRKPWTNDPILQSFFFTSPYRENDKTTVWFREKVRRPLRDTFDVVFATVCFRWFNYIPTGEILKKGGWLTQWNRNSVVRRLGQVRDAGGQVFTGAFMINSPGGEPKLEAICRRVGNVWKDRRNLIQYAKGWKTFQQAHGDLTCYEGLGGFMAYEVVTDLRHTTVLDKATDKSMWCNPGPGCIRGLYRIAGEEIENKSNATSPPRPKDWLHRMNRLLSVVRREFSGKGMPAFEMREIEHSLCEFDKYERALSGDGKLKRKFAGV